jgi:hypothetical protein
MGRAMKVNLPRGSAILKDDTLYIFRRRNHLVKVLDNAVGINYEAVKNLKFNKVLLDLEGEKYVVFRDKLLREGIVRAFSFYEKQIFLPLSKWHKLN